MKLKTTITANDGDGSVSLTIVSNASARCLTRYEQERHHEQTINNVHATLLGRFNVRQIRVR